LLRRKKQLPINKKKKSLGVYAKNIRIRRKGGLKTRKKKKGKNLTWNY